MARSQYHHGNLREALVGAAVQLLDEKGVRGLSLRAVARKAGVSQSALYHHFAGKEALVAEVCRRAFRALSEKTSAALEGRHDTEDRLRAMAHAYLSFSEENPEAFGIMFGGKGMLENKEDYEGLMDMVGGSLEQLLTVIAEGIEREEICCERPIDAALSVWAAVHGAVALLRDHGLDSPKMKALGAKPSCFLDSVVSFMMVGMRPR